MISAATKTDTLLRQDVIDALDFDPRITAAHLGVSAKGGVITLTGKVPTYTERVHADAVVLNVQGVQALADEVEVDLPATHHRDDEDIARDISAMLKANLVIPRDHVKVKVHKGTVTLSGEVDWHYQKAAAEQTVVTITGVTGVIDLLTVKAKPQASWSGVKKQISGAFQRHASLDAQKVKVDVDGGHVTLGGKVRSWAERRDAENAAWSAPGVHNVTNLLEVDYGV